MKAGRLAPIAVACVVAVAGGWWYFSAGRAPTEKKATPPVTVLMAKAELRDVPLMLDLNGRAEAIETVSLKSRVDGQVQSVQFSDGRHVASGEVLLKLDPADYDARLRQAEATLARDQAQLAKAQSDVERAIALKAKGFVSDAGVETARAAAQAAEATVKADQAALDLARLQLGYTTVRAPFAGIVGARLVFPGTAVKANDTVLAVVNRVQPILIAFSVPEKYLQRLRATRRGEKAAVSVSVPGEDKAQAGHIGFIDNAVDPTTGTVLIKAQLTNQDERLTPGQFVDVALTVEKLNHVVTVPAAAIQQGPEGSYVFVVKPDQTVEMRKLTLTATQHGLAVIASGLAAGETVVTEGQLRLVPGAKVRLPEAKPKDAKQ